VRRDRNDQICLVFVFGARIIMLLLILALAVSSRPSKHPLPSVDHEEVLSAFNLSTAALSDTWSDPNDDRLTRMTQIAPDEPAGWINLCKKQCARGQLDETMVSRATSD